MEQPKTVIEREQSVTNVEKINRGDKSSFRSIRARRTQSMIRPKY